MEKERIEAVQELTDSMQERERQFQTAKQETAKELSKTQQELETLDREKQRLQLVCQSLHHVLAHLFMISLQEYESEREKLSKALEKAQEKAAKQVGKVKEQLAQNEADHQRLVAQLQQQRQDLEKRYPLEDSCCLWMYYMSHSCICRIDTVKSEYAMKEKEFSDRVEALLKEKRELAEKHFAETQKLSALDHWYYLLIIFDNH